MAVEVFRKLIGGVWRTVVEDPGGNGGSQPYEWAQISINDRGAVLSVASNEWDADITTDLTIVDQSAKGIFSLDPALGLISSEDGWYTLGGYCTRNPSDATLDGASTLQRWLWVQAGIGDDSPFIRVGYDTLVPLGGLATMGATALVGVPSPYTADPSFATRLLRYVGVVLVGTGTDTYAHPASVLQPGLSPGVGGLVVYKVAPLA